MKIQPDKPEHGMITVIFIALLAIMMILLTAEARCLLRLRQETRLLQQQQIERLDIATTNNVTATIHQAK